MARLQKGARKFWDCWKRYPLQDRAFPPRATRNSPDVRGNPHIAEESVEEQDLNNRHHETGRSAIALTAVFVVTVTILLSGCRGKDVSQPTFNAVDITGAAWGNDFRLTDHNGQLRTLADFRGKAVAVFFGYLNCPDVCPTTMAKLAATKDALGKDGDRLQVLLITLDPKRDTPDILRQYVPAFHPTFLGLYGDEVTTATIAKEFKIFAERQKPNADGFYTVDHNGGIFVFDPGGRIRLFFSDEHGPEAIAQDLRALLAQINERSKG